jgi:hypothetical protein
VEAATLYEYDWNGRTGRRHRDAILEFLGVRTFDDAGEEAFRTWLMTNALPKEPNADTLDEWITAWLCSRRSIVPAATAGSSASCAGRLTSTFVRADADPRREGRGGGLRRARPG